MTKTTNGLGASQAQNKHTPVPGEKVDADLLKFRNCATSIKTIKEARAQAVEAGQDQDVAEHAAMIRRLGKPLLTDIIEIGRRLTAAKKIKRGGWEAWLKAEFGWTKQTSLNFERVYELSQSKNFLPDVTIAPSALYLLTRPNTPEEIRDKVLDDAKAGKKISVNDVKAALKEHDEPEVTEPEAASDTPDSAQTKNNKRWFNAACECAREAVGFAKVVNNAEPKLSQALREVAEPGLLPIMREGGQALIRLADFFDGLLKEEKEERQALAEAAE